MYRISASYKLARQPRSGEGARRSTLTAWPPLLSEVHPGTPHGSRMVLCKCEHKLSITTGCLTERTTRYGKTRPKHSVLNVLNKILFPRGERRHKVMITNWRVIKWHPTQSSVLGRLRSGRAASVIGHGSSPTEIGY
jgi:hypothetical protein